MCRLQGGIDMSDKSQLGNITHSIICLLKKFLYALPKDCVCLWIFHVSSPVELFLYALPKDCVCLWIFHVSSPVELFLYALPKDCTAQGLCLPLNIPCFQSGGTIFWSKSYKKLKKKFNWVKMLASFSFILFTVSI